MAMIRDKLDPKDLIAESYRIDGISQAECRAIFLDWALSLPVDADARAFLLLLLERHGTIAPDHPMTAILTEGLNAPSEPARRRRRGRGQ